MPSKTYIYKTDPSAGDIPAYVHFPTSPSRNPDDPSPTTTTTDDAHPIAIIFHAGGFGAGSTAMIPPAQVSRLVALGFVVVLPEYRLAPQVTLHDGAMADAQFALAWAKSRLPELLWGDEGVRVDGERVGVVGESAGGTLALGLGNSPSPPTAILDFYGLKYLSDPFWSQPLPAFYAIPPPPPLSLAEFLAGPVALTGAPMFIDGAPNLVDPRAAWMIDALRTGTLYSQAVGDGNVERVEPTRGFSGAKSKGEDGAARKWPPTCFVHGDADVFAPIALTERAVKELKEAGAEVEFVRVEGAAHVFDFGLKEGDELFDGPVVKALQWLRDHV